jgi:GTPase SAR1 family protein
MLVYGITSPPTFSSLPQWLDELHENAEMTIVAVLLVGNKSDLQESRPVTIEDAVVSSKSEDLLSIETFALNNSNLQEAFVKLVTEIVKKLDQEGPWRPKAAENLPKPISVDARTRKWS